MSPQVMGIAGTTFGSGKVHGQQSGSNNGSSSGGSVFSGVGHKSGSHWGQPPIGCESKKSGSILNESGRGLMLNKMRSGSSMGGYG